MSSVATDIDVRRVAGSIGAEITGVRVGPDLPGPVVKLIRDTLLEHKVVFFRGQHDLDDVTQAATVWHTDKTTTVRPTAITILRPVVLPPYGGDTAWANTAAAYQRMGLEWQQLADGLRARHTNNQAGAKRLRADAFARAAQKDSEQSSAAPAVAEVFQGARQDAGLSVKNLYEAEHPVVHVHPETGERALLLGAFAKTILGREDSESLINLFQAFVTPLDNTVRWQWSPGDVGMWDNRATQHCAVGDYGSHKRLMHRVTVHGEVPVGVDGRPSVTITCPS